jgi:hypothetical protein
VGCSEARPHRFEAELLVYCMAAVSRSSRISSQARRASGFDGSGMLRRSMAAVTTFWLARPKTRGVYRSILGDATIDVVSSFSSSTAMCMCRALLLEGSLQ